MIPASYIKSSDYVITLTIDVKKQFDCLHIRDIGTSDYY